MYPMDYNPPRLLSPWDFPGKNTGVTCHFLHQGIFLTRDWTLSPTLAGGFFLHDNSIGLAKKFIWVFHILRGKPKCTFWPSQYTQATDTSIPLNNHRPWTRKSNDPNKMGWGRKWLPYLTGSLKPWKWHRGGLEGCSGWLEHCIRQMAAVHPETS